MKMRTRDFGDMRIFLDFPYKATAEMKVCKLLGMPIFLLCQVYVRAPVVDMRGVVHLVKFKMFMDSPSTPRAWYGVLGTNKMINVDEVYDIQHMNSDRTNTHMQHDTIYGDFGYMTSNGYDG